MMIANAAATPPKSPARIDASNEVPSPDAANEGPDAAGGKGFGQVLARQMDAGDATPAADARDATDKSTAEPTGDELAAQLALVSQWAALSPPAAAPANGDIKARLDTVRGKGTAVGELAAGASGPGVGATGRGAASMSAASGKDIGAALDAVLARLDASGAEGRSGDTNPASAFVAQMTAQTSSSIDGSAAAIPTAPTITVREPVGTTAWAHEVGSATLRMAAGDLQSASLRLSPEHLGPVDVQLRIDNGVANVTFNAAHAETRQALEASRTTLDQMFSDQGIRLGDCAVGDFASSRQGFDANAAPRDSGGRASGIGTTEADSGTSTVTVRLKQAPGLVDTFA